MEENEKNSKKEKFFKKMKRPKDILKIGISTVLILVVVLIIINFLKVNNDIRVAINTKTSLEKIIEISELSTIEYTYNSIATKYKNDEIKEDNVEYYVTYEGIVRAGIDFNEIDINVNYKSKTIVITLPKVEIHEVSVDMGTLDYIYEKNTSEKDSISQEAYKLCKKDLRERASNETQLVDNAKSNAESAIEALLKPWAEAIDKDFKIEFKQKGE